VSLNFPRNGRWFEGGAMEDSVHNRMGVDIYWGSGNCSQLFLIAGATD
jgi:hypothetical protein